MHSLRLLRLTSCQSENSEHIGRALAAYVGPRIGIETEFVDDVPWQERERLLDEGTIHAGWICGLPYVQKADCLRPGLELIAAPVMAGKRYAGRPVYFSDVVVRRDHPAHSFLDLRGSRWGYNEPGSHSGYNVVRYQLARRCETAGYFSRVVETGAHQATLRKIADGEIDASAIDSTVLETEFMRHPGLRRTLRVVESWGPSPAPPWVVSRRVPAALRSKLRQLFRDLHGRAAGRAILRKARMACFAGVSDRDYDPIRRMSCAAEEYKLSI
jgi:ABC-type phosphate/phosphonate transport system substrate-binding protein